MDYFAASLPVFDRSASKPFSTIPRFYGFHALRGSVRTNLRGRAYVRDCFNSFMTPEGSYKGVGVKISSMELGADEVSH